MVTMTLESKVDPLGPPKTCAIQWATYHPIFPDLQIMQVFKRRDERNNVWQSFQCLPPNERPIACLAYILIERGEKRVELDFAHDDIEWDYGVDGWVPASVGCGVSVDAVMPHVEIMVNDLMNEWRVEGVRKMIRDALLNEKDVRIAETLRVAGEVIERLYQQEDDAMTAAEKLQALVEG